MFGATGMVGQAVLRECLLDPAVTSVVTVGRTATGRRHTMWARVKGETENDLLALLPRAYMFRPGYIHPMNGEKPRSRVYAVLVPVIRPFFPVLRRLMPKSYTTTEALGRAMIRVAAAGAPKRVLESPDINEAGGKSAR